MKTGFVHSDRGLAVLTQLAGPCGMEDPDFALERCYPAVTQAVSKGSRTPPASLLVAYVLASVLLPEGAIPEPQQNLLSICISSNCSRSLLPYF